MSADEKDHQHQHAYPHRCPACEWKSWVESLRHTALWTRLTTPPRVLEQWNKQIKETTDE